MLYPLFFVMKPCKHPSGGVSFWKSQIPKFSEKSLKNKSGQLIIYIRPIESNPIVLPCNINKLVQGIHISGQINAHRNQHALDL